MIPEDVKISGEAANGEISVNVYLDTSTELSEALSGFQTNKSDFTIEHNDKSTRNEDREDEEYCLLNEDADETNETPKSL